MDALRQAIELLYETFARHPRPVHVDFCPCGCTKPEETARLLFKPLRELAFKDTNSYVFSAMTTQGTEDDFRYFLPRLLEGIATDADYYAEVLFSKLPYAMWSTWPEDERAAVHTYLRALWPKALSSFPLRDELPSFPDIESMLVCIAQTDKLLPYLEVWSEMRCRSADQHLVQFVTMFGSNFADGGTLREAFWEKIISQGDDLRDWLLQAATLERVTHSAHLLPCDGFEHLFEPAMVTLQMESSRIHRGDLSS
jgi:hypothetical protein